MPVLNWIGKEAVAKHDKEVPFRLLKKVKSASIGENSQNLIIHGDNLEALKALMPFYYGKVKCIYIDPPYNTGNESWVYNDRVNSPKIKQWLGKVVGRESEDLTRHDKWLCMMYPRLKLLKDLLAEDGVIFVSIDDNEQHNLRQIMDELFGENDNIGPIIQNKLNAKNDTLNTQKNHEYILIYRKNEIKKDGKTLPTLISKRGDVIEVFNENQNFYYIGDPITTRGEGGILNARKNLGYSIYIEPTSGDFVAVMDYDIEKAKTSNNEKEVYLNDESLLRKGYIIIRPPKVRGKLGAWTWDFNRFNNKRYEIYIRKTKNGYSVNKKIFVNPADVYEVDNKYYLNRNKSGNSKSIVEFSTNEGTDSYNQFLEPGTFNNPKSVEMIKYLIGLYDNNNALVLDSFAGSGTTAQAVLELNNDDGGNRNFILVELEDSVAKDITAERVKQAIQKYGYKDGFEYCELDKPLFNEKGQIEDECSFDQFATYIYFTETQTNIDVKGIKGNYIGGLEDTLYYLIYKGKNKNDLNKSFLKNLDRDGKKKVIYADRCLIDEDLLFEYNIVFKQIPYEVKVY
ncbi:site-specific DNA-methyltransferase [Candidatus Microgenomates bacterium]|nr:MAG: site-specific DNA-methyltransferase [Candidatus Microgenomates bacterium]